MKKRPTYRIGADKLINSNLIFSANKFVNNIKPFLDWNIDGRQKPQPISFAEIYQFENSILDPFCWSAINYFNINLAT